MTNRSPGTRAAATALLLLTACAPAATGARQHGAEPRPATRAIHLDGGGLIRWTDTGEEVVLFGANYALPSSGDYRAAGYLTDDRKRLIDQDMAHFARMGWDGLRVAFWGDWQNADLEGNLIENDHLDLMDYLIARAKERGIYILFNPIHTYNAGWPDAMGDSFPGFAAHFPKSELGRDSAAIAAQTNYLRQILDHVNPYTGVRLADEPAILFVEMINEPAHHPEDLAGSVAYIDSLVAAVRDAGSGAITFHNVSQDFRIAEAIVRSDVQGASFGWYPTGLNSGRELRGNHLRAVEAYPPLRMPDLEGVPKVVYEFDSADQLTAVMYPAMARAYREGGVQLAAMFAYDMLETASRNLGWQTHYLNLVYTPRKAMSAVIAAEAMRRLPRLETYGPYPANNRFGPFHLSPDDDVAVLAARDAYINAGPTTIPAPAPDRLTRIAGYGPSPLVEYPGEGVYFLDRVREGVWRLEVYPDAIPVADPFEPPNVDKVVTRAIWRRWPMRLRLPDLGEQFLVRPLDDGNTHEAAARDGRFYVRPGVYLLTGYDEVDPSSLPDRIGGIGFREFVAPPPDSGPPAVRIDVAAQHPTGAPLEVTAHVVTDSTPIGVELWTSPAGRDRFTPRGAFRHLGAYDYRLTIDPQGLPDGVYDLRVVVATRQGRTTFPGAVPGHPGAWDFPEAGAVRVTVLPPTTPVRLLDPDVDVPRLSFSRIGDGWREGIFQVVPSTGSGEPALRLELPVNVDGITPDDYTMSLGIGDRIRGRGETIMNATGVRLRLRGIGDRQTVHVTLLESDGTGWSAPLTIDSGFDDRFIPLSEFRIGRGVKLPQGFPGSWNYWLDAAAGRGGPADAMRLQQLERLQLSLRRPDGAAVEAGSYGIIVESVTLVFE